MCVTSCFLFLIGLNSTICLLLEIKNIIISLLAKKNLADYGQGSWALITACTDGIGKGFANSLAKKGFNIVQVGRNPEKLSAAANDLKAKYGVEVKSIVKDFSFCTQDPIAFFTDIYKQTADLDISILVNNIGTNTGNVLFKDLKINNLLDMLALNLFPITFLSKFYIEKLQNRALGGAVVSLSSVRSGMYYYQYVTYSACKAYDQVISMSLSVEEKVRTAKAKVDIMSLHPGYVDTPLVRARKGKFLEISPDECAEAALRCIGQTDSTSAHWKHLLTSAMLKTVAPLSVLMNK